MKVSDLNSNEYNDYYGRYINLVSSALSLVEAYSKGREQTIRFFSDLPIDKLEYRYAIDKWTPKEIMQHLIDTERIFMYRCLRIARNDKTPLAGFDQNTYIDPSGANQKTMDQLLEEFDVNRKNSIQLLESLSEENLAFIGNASGSDLSARAAAFIIPGHDIWHCSIIKERYL